MKARTIIVGMAVAFTLLLGLGWAGWQFFGGVVQEYLNRRPFDAAAWQAARGTTNTTRIHMVDDVLRRHRLRGMPREQLTALLGQPDDTRYFKEWDLVYRLGPERRVFSIDSEWLVIALDTETRVRDYKVVTD